MKLLHKLFPSLQVRAEIKKIIREEYGNYKGNMLQELKAAHKHLRKVMGAREFLIFLQQQIVSNPRPKYVAPYWLHKNYLNVPTMICMTDEKGCSYIINPETLAASPIGPSGCTGPIDATDPTGITHTNQPEC